MEVNSTIDKGGAPEGNQNAKKGKVFFDELRKFFAQNPQKKREIVEGLVEAAIAREPWAVKEIMDRMDGKPHQSTSIEDGEGNPLLSGIQVTFVKPDVRTD